jgi:ABC-type siderophore export system fused ATPase/permease subunit
MLARVNALASSAVSISHIRLMLGGAEWFLALLSLGQILIDGRSVLDKPAHHRSRFAGIFSDFFLFPHVLDAAGNCVPDAQI